MTLYCLASFTGGDFQARGQHVYYHSVSIDQALLPKNMFRVVGGIFTQNKVQTALDPAPVMKLAPWHLVLLFSLAASSRLRRRDESSEYTTVTVPVGIDNGSYTVSVVMVCFVAILAPATELSVFPSQRVLRRNISHLGSQQALAILPSRAQVARRAMVFSRMHILSLSHSFSQIS